MKLLLPLGLALLIAQTGTAAAPKSAPSKKPALSKKSAASKVRPRAQRKPPPAAVPIQKNKPNDDPQARLEAPSSTPLDSDLAQFGAVLLEKGNVLETAAVLDGSFADDLSLKPGDRLLQLGSAGLKSRQDAGRAFRSLMPEGRTSAVVIRGLDVRSLTGNTPPAFPDKSRAAADLSAREKIFQAARDQAAAASADEIRARARWDVTVPAGQSVWVRFTKGFPRKAEPGEVIEAETVSPAATDNELDFIAIPPKSRLWAVIVDAPGPSETVNLRLAFFRINVAGGGLYPIVARVTDISGDQVLAKTSPGGTIVYSQLEKPASDLRAKISLMEPLVLTEPAGYYHAGPGFWVQHDGRGYKISHVVTGRSAAQAGVKTGEYLVSIKSVKVKDHEFDSVIGQLYGLSGESVKVGVGENPNDMIRSLELVRGVKHKDDIASAIPYPYMSPSTPAAPARAPEAASAPQSAKSDSSEAVKAAKRLKRPSARRQPSPKKTAAKKK